MMSKWKTRKHIFFHFLSVDSLLACSLHTVAQVTERIILFFLIPVASPSSLLWMQFYAPHECGLLRVTNSPLLWVTCGHICSNSCIGDSFCPLQECISKVPALQLCIGNPKAPINQPSVPHVYFWVCFYKGETQWRGFVGWFAQTKKTSETLLFARLEQFISFLDRLLRTCIWFVFLCCHERLKTCGTRVKTVKSHLYCMCKTRWKGTQMMFFCCFCNELLHFQAWMLFYWNANLKTEPLILSVPCQWNSINDHMALAFLYIYLLLQ